MRAAHRVSSGPTQESQHVPALDGVRGMAILAVLVTHLLASNDVSSSWWVQAILSVRDQLWIGVTLFFSLSGFLITGILYDTLGTENYFRTFYGRRILRIFPLYYGVLVVLLVATPVLHLNWQGQAWRLWTYTPNIPFTREWLQNPAPYLALNHFWSLAVEEQFYLIWPFVISRIRSWRGVLIAAIAGSAIALVLRTWAAMSHYTPQNHSLPFCMDALLFGAVLALLVRSPYRSLTLCAAPWIAMTGFVSILIEALRDPGLTWASSFYFTSLGVTVAALATTCLVGASLNHGSRVQQFFSFGPLRFLGTYSYGIYVYHYSIDAALNHPLRHWLETRGASKVIAIPTAALPVATLSIAVAWLSYNLYEKRFLAMKRFFPYRRKVRTEDYSSPASNHSMSCLTE